MTVPTFKVGDYVEIIPNDAYFITRGYQRGTIIHICTVADEEDPPLYYLSWDSKQPEHTLGPYDEDLSDSWEISAQYLKLIQSIPKEERIALKIKTLWNTSNYVKKNPSQAYV